jgi:hypothetical protein
VPQPVLQVGHGRDLVHAIGGVNGIGDRHHQRGRRGAAGVLAQGEARDLNGHG